MNRILVDFGCLMSEKEPRLTRALILLVSHFCPYAVALKPWIAEQLDHRIAPRINGTIPIGVNGQGRGLFPVYPPMPDGLPGRADQSDGFSGSQLGFHRFL